MRQGAETTVLCSSAIRFSQFYLCKALYNIYTVSCPWSAVRTPYSAFYTDHILIILVMLVILVIQVITIILEITITPYQCCQSYLKSLKICSKVTISSRGTICYMNNKQSAFTIIAFLHVSLILYYYDRALYLG